MKEFIVENLLVGSTASFFDVAIKLFMALVIGATIYIAYYFTSSKVSYNSNFNLSLVAMDLCQYFGQKKLKDYAAFFSSSSSFC